MFEKNKPKFEPQAVEKSNRILWLEGGAFFAIIVLSWVTEAIHIPHLIYGESFTPNWHRAIIRTVVISLIWAGVHTTTRKLLKRLHYLEEFLRVCSWCRKVSHGNDWIEMENYLRSKFATKTSHGMCPDCLQKKKDELATGHKTPTTIR